MTNKILHLFLQKKRKRFLFYISIAQNYPYQRKIKINGTFLQFSIQVLCFISFFCVPLHTKKRPQLPKEAKAPKTKIMEITEQTIQQVERFIRKVAQKFPAQSSEEESIVLTDIHVRVSQDSGELLAFDDDDNEITRCVVEQWIDNKDENFYDEVAKILRDTLRKNSETVDNLGILKPYSFVLEDDDKENLGELYLADDDTIIVGGDLMEGLDNDLDSFLDNLLKE